MPETVGFKAKKVLFILPSPRSVPPQTEAEALEVNNGLNFNYNKFRNSGLSDQTGNNTFLSRLYLTSNRSASVCEGTDRGDDF